MSVRAMPEWLTRRDDTPSAWNVMVGAAARGEAWTNRVERAMRVPDGNDPLARVIRAHEMMHAKVSPLLMDPTPFGVSEDALRSAEEYRVNLLIGEAGFDLNELADGSEKQAGKRLAESKDWNTLVTAMAATAGTKSASELIAGVRAIDPDMAASLKEVEKAIINKWHEVVGRKRGISQYERKAAAAKIGSTAPSHDFPDCPAGFIKFTIPLARMLETYMRSPEADSEGDGAESTENFPEAEKIKRDRTGKEQMLKFRPVILGDLPLSRRINGSFGRKRKASPMGRNPRRMHRMLVDPERRIFDQTARGNGGIVVIDMSGSMELQESHIMQMLEAAPGCTIIGYGNTMKEADSPNLWILAENGKVTETIPALTLTNGNDGPALRFAAAKRRKSEPFIWITDGNIHNGGYLTNSVEISSNLLQECTDAIVKYGIHQIDNIQSAVAALKNPSEGRKMFVTAWTLKRHMPRG
jgi:hypothetical protein